MKFASKKLALKLKEKGFDKPCFGWYYIKTPTGATEGELVLNRYPCRGGTYEETLESHINFPPKEKFLGYIKWNMVDAPTTDQVLEWLRDEKNINISVQPYLTKTTKNNIMWQWEILLVGKIIECGNTLYADKVYNYTKLASHEYCAIYEDACIAGIEFVIDNCI